MPSCFVSFTGISKKAFATRIMRQENELIPHLFRTEYAKIVAVLCKLLGIEHMQLAEDMVSDTFLLAAETWGMKGLPPNPVAWLYTVAKNKARDVLKRNAIFSNKIAATLRHSSSEQITEDIDIDLSEQNIADSQLQMMFTVCHPCIPAESRIGLALNILCGFSADEIADAFLTNREVIYKRLRRAKEKLHTENIKIEMPGVQQVAGRLDDVLTTLYLLFNEGYYSASQNTVTRKDLCLEAMRLSQLLTQNRYTNTPEVNALLALMCFHASRFDARTDATGATVLYDEQDEYLWNNELIEQGKYFLSYAGTEALGKYYFEANIAYWHTHKADSIEKWQNVLHLYNQLLQLEYSPVAALNRTYALSKVYGKQAAIPEAEKLGLRTHLYYVLLGYLFSGIDNTVALAHMRTALSLCRSENDKASVKKNIERLLHK